MGWGKGSTTPQQLPNTPQTSPTTHNLQKLTKTDQSWGQQKHPRIEKPSPKPSPDQKNNQIIKGSAPTLFEDMCYGAAALSAETYLHAAP